MKTQYDQMKQRYWKKDEMSNDYVIRRFTIYWKQRYYHLL